jgi:hypothetical protein
MPTIDDEFHRRLNKLLVEKMDNRMVQLANGGAMQIRESTTTVAENYAAQVAYIKALNDVIGWCQEVEDEKYGKTPKPQKFEA